MRVCIDSVNTCLVYIEIIKFTLEIIPSILKDKIITAILPNEKTHQHSFN